ncbi:MULTISPECIES: hypothetical protein [unclassified Neglectibacter]|uniref:hypothetical protein n=1 Tax=unclassified Neglectibacter TaxID=2632164 RepID=UPI00136D81DF|nr:MULTISPECIES: hypothetical protein [unclassified Neglectibacter]NCE80801.1 hypothetical protein [Neglectibacter sp. X58]
MKEAKYHLYLNDSEYSRRVKESVRSAGKKSIKTTQRATAKTAKKSVKTAERTAKTTVKTTKEAAKATEREAKVAAKSAQKAAQAAKAAAKAAAEGLKAAIKVTIAAIKAIIAATKALITAIAAGGWVAVIVIVIICLVGLVASSIFGIFFSGEDSGTGMTMQTAVQEINADYDARLEAEKNAVLSAWRALSLFWRVSSFHSLPLRRPLSILMLWR